jgi:beta-glucosidase
MQAADSNTSQTLSFTGTGLPPGITIASNGTISGSTRGTCTVTVTATDTEGVSGTATFVWSVAQ